MSAIIISIGNELISGQAVDTNSAHLARELGRCGIETIAHWTIDDNRRSIAAGISAAAAKADLVVVTGGLGPTDDDLTRGALADAMDSELILDRRCLDQLEGLFRKRGREMVAANRRQAMIPKGAEALKNPLGTAPGIAAKVCDADVFVLPGVPHEMESMFDNAVAPRLKRGRRFILHRLVHACGAGESDVADRIGDLMERRGDVTVGITVAASLITIRITSRAETHSQAQRLADQTAGQIRQRLGELVVGEDDDTMASVVGDLLRANSQTLATAESCTGGLIGQMITSAPGSSDYYLGGIVAYSNDVKLKHLGVPEDILARNGAVSEPVARAMAAGAVEAFQSDWAISVTGIAGPSGGSDQKPVGLIYVGLAWPDGAEVYRHILGGTRDLVRRRAALAALNHLRLRLMGRA